MKNIVDNNKSLPAAETTRKSGRNSLDGVGKAVVAPFALVTSVESPVRDVDPDASQSQSSTDTPSSFYSSTANSSLVMNSNVVHSNESTKTVELNAANESFDVMTSSPNQALLASPSPAPIESSPVPMNARKMDSSGIISSSSTSSAIIESIENVQVDVTKLKSLSDLIQNSSAESTVQIQIQKKSRQKLHSVVSPLRRSPSQSKESNYQPNQQTYDEMYVSDQALEDEELEEDEDELVALSACERQQLLRGWNENENSSLDKNLSRESLFNQDPCHNLSHQQSSLVHHNHDKPPYAHGSKSSSKNSSTRHPNLTHPERHRKIEIDKQKSSIHLDSKTFDGHDDIKDIAINLTTTHENQKAADRDLSSESPCPLDIDILDENSFIKEKHKKKKSKSMSMPMPVPVPGNLKLLKVLTEKNVSFFCYFYFYFSAFNTFKVCLSKP